MFILYLLKPGITRKHKKSTSVKNKFVHNVLQWEREYFELANCTECKYGQKDVVGRKCQACINKNMFEHIWERLIMDWRNRKYYLVKLPYYHNACVKKLKEIKTVKIANPYDFDKGRKYKYENCLIGFSNNVENSVLTILNSKWEYGYKAKYKEITKEMIGH